MTLMAAATPGSDSGLSSDARLLHEQRLRGFWQSATVGAMDRAELLQTIQNLAENARINDWDGEGSAAVEPSTLRYAARFLFSLPQVRTVPSVTIDRDGEIAFDWGENPQHTFSVSVSRDGRLTFAGYFHGAQTWGYEPIGEQAPGNILLNIERAER
jgi:hypothetical protein